MIRTVINNMYLRNNFKIFDCSAKGLHSVAELNEMILFYIGYRKLNDYNWYYFYCRYTSCIIASNHLDRHRYYHF